MLATLGNNAPFIGLLGTVLGIIKASQDLAAAQAAKQMGTAAVMSGVFEALVATAVGLFVAIPAVIAYNFFQRRVRRPWAGRLGCPPPAGLASPHGGGRVQGGDQSRGHSHQPVGVR